MAIVLPAVGVVPLAVDPPDHCPVQMEQEQYPVSLNLPRYVPLEELLEVSDADGLPVVVEDALLSEELLPELLLVSVSAFAAAFAASAAATHAASASAACFLAASASASAAACCAAAASSSAFFCAAISSSFA